MDATVVGLLTCSDLCITMKLLIEPVLFTKLVAMTTELCALLWRNAEIAARVMLVLSHLNIESTRSKIMVECPVKKT